VGLEWVWGLLQPGFVRWAPLLHKTTLTSVDACPDGWPAMFSTGLYAFFYNTAKITVKDPQTSRTSERIIVRYSQRSSDMAWSGGGELTYSSTQQPCRHFSVLYTVCTKSKPTVFFCHILFFYKFPSNLANSYSSECRTVCALHLSISPDMSAQHTLLCNVTRDKIGTN